MCRCLTHHSHALLPLAFSASLAAASAATIACDWRDVTAPRGRSPVDWLDVTPASALVPVGAARQFAAVPRDRRGVAVAGQHVVWSSSDPAVVAVDARTGLAAARRAGRATITATSGGQAGTAVIVAFDLDTPRPLPAPTRPESLP